MVQIALDALGGLRLNVERTGNGPPILAIHGFTGSLLAWDFFSKAARGEYSVTCLDLPGHGSSDAPDNPQPYSMKNTVRALSELLDSLNIERVHWLGYSMGGRIALAAACLLRERTLSLILESASPGLANPDERELRRLSDEALATKVETEGIEAFVEHWESLPLWQSQDRLPEKVRQKLRLQRLTNNPVGLNNSLRGIGTGAQPSFQDLLPGLQVPTLFIVGEEDDKFVGIAQEMHSMVIGSQIRIVKESGHTVHLEQPDLFNRIVLEFLKSIKDSSTLEAQIWSQLNQ